MTIIQTNGGAGVGVVVEEVGENLLTVAKQLGIMPEDRPTHVSKSRMFRAACSFASKNDTYNGSIFRVVRVRENLVIAMARHSFFVGSYVEKNFDFVVSGRAFKHETVEDAKVFDVLTRFKTNAKPQYRIKDPCMFKRDGLSGDLPIDFVKGGFRVGKTEYGVNLNIIKNMPNWQPVEVTKAKDGQPFLFRPADKSWLLVVMPMRSGPLQIEEI